MKKFLLAPLLCALTACYEERHSTHKIKTIIFDFDGTVADTFLLAIKCINTLSAEYGYKPLESAQDIEAFRAMSAHEMLCNRLGLKYYQVPGAVLRAKNLIKEDLKDVAVFDGIKQLLQALATNYELAIITSNSREAVDHVLQKAGITSIKYIHSDSSIFGKHVVIKRFLKAHNVANNEAIYIGDEIRDIEACKKIGVKIIAVTWGYNTKHALKKAAPDCLVDSCEQIEKLVGSYNLNYVE